MANLEHSTMASTNLHENKGVASAANNTVATAVGGVTVWAKLTSDNLTGTGNAFSLQLLQVQDQKPAGTSGGTFTSGAWQTRTLNTALTSEISGASLSANQITLPSGTYYIEAYAVAYTVGWNKIRFRNITDGTTAIVGSTSKSDGGAFSNIESRLAGRFTIAGSKVFELQHYCQNTIAGTGFGFGSATGEIDLYADARIWKVA